MTLLDADVLAEFSPVGLKDRRAWFAVRLRPRAAAAEKGVQLVLTIDRSSSMAGSKLEQARIAAMAVVQMMGDDDKLAILSFDEHVEVVLRWTRTDKNGKRLARQLLTMLQAGRGTALYAATEQSLALANEMARGHAVLITDGFPYSGITEADQIIAMTTRRSGAATLTTIGVGSELDAALLVAMAGVGGGRFLHLDEHGNLAATLGGELATVRGAATGKIDFRLQTARGFSIATVPHYASLLDTVEPPSTAGAILAPAVSAEEQLIPFELAWTSDLDPREHQAALVTLRVQALGSSAVEVIELPIRLAVAPERGAMNATTTRAVCEIMAGRALHHAALGVDPPKLTVRLLADAASWIRGRAGAASLDPLRDLGPMLRVLAVAQELFDQEDVDAPLLHACAVGLAKHYDASLGSRNGMLDELRSEPMTMGSNIGTNIGSRIQPVKPVRK
jgi:Mg-chelatase subunit ChlD